MVILSMHLAKEKINISKKQNKVQKVIDIKLVYDNRAFSEQRLDGMSASSY